MIAAMSHLPAPATMYRAFVRRDPAYEGVFWLGVRTTGIFCRPTCRARTPNRENVEFFAAPTEALHAGYRPCRKCRPLDHGRKPPPLVEKLLVAVEEEPGRRYRDAELAQMGIDPSTARRQFKRYCGMTFQAYHRARRMGLALLDIRKGKTVLDSQLDQGFESGSGFREAFARLVGTAPSRAQDVGVLHAKWLETPLGAMLALADDRGLHLLDFVDRRGLERALAMLQRRLNARVLPAEHRYLAQIERELCEYFAGTRHEFQTPVALTGSAFQTARVESAAGHSCGHDVLVCGARGADRPAESGARRRPRQRRQPVVDHRALSSRDRRRRRADRLWRRTCAQAEAAGPRTRGDSQGA